MWIYKNNAVCLDKMTNEELIFHILFLQQKIYELEFEIMKNKEKMESEVQTRYWRMVEKLLD